MPEHEVVGDMAHLCTIHEQTNVMSIGMFASLFEAVVNFMKTSIMTLFAVVDALMHLRALMFMNV